MMVIDMKEEFEIKNYIKLICLRIDHYESYIEDEVNVNDISGINKFVQKHRGEEGIKIFMIQMNDGMEMITIKDVRRYIKNVHAFDYIRNLIADGHTLITADNIEKMSIGEIVNYMLDFKKE